MSKEEVIVSRAFQKLLEFVHRVSCFFILTESIVLAIEMAQQK